MQFFKTFNFFFYSFIAPAFAGRCSNLPMHFPKQGFHVAMFLLSLVYKHSLCEARGTWKRRKEGRQRVLGAIRANPDGDLGKANLAELSASEQGGGRCQANLSSIRGEGATRFLHALGKAPDIRAPLSSSRPSLIAARVSLWMPTHCPRGGRQRGARPVFVWAGISLGLVLSATRARSPRGLSRRGADNGGHESPFSAPRAVGSQALSVASRKEKQKPAKSLSFLPSSPVL